MNLKQTNILKECNGERVNGKGGWWISNGNGILVVVSKLGVKTQLRTTFRRSGGFGGGGGAGAIRHRKKTGSGFDDECYKTKKNACIIHNEAE